jgi:hypothetical protein
VAELRKRFPDWPPSRFSTWSEKSFENYFPTAFNSDVAGVLAIKDRQIARHAKKELLDRVLAWIESDEDFAKVQFRESAAEVIEALHRVAQELDGAGPL